MGIHRPNEVSPLFVVNGWRIDLFVKAEFSPNHP